MDPKKFQAWLTEIAEWHRPIPADVNRRSHPIPEDQRQTGCEIQSLHECAVPCEWCPKTCSNRSIKRWILQPTSTGQAWRGYCETCRLKYYPETGQMGYTGFVKQGVRQAAPGRRLGRPARKPPAPWWAGDDGVILTGQDPGERRAELLDRLAALKRQDK
jgi:hypothetical protein